MTKYKVYTIEKGLIETNFIYDEIYNNLTCHREDGPAYIRYYNNGKVAYEEYWYNNKKHRLDGPSDIEYDTYGNIKKVEYYINNISYTKEQYDKELLKLKINSL